MAREYRLNKFISESGYCSRREADELIRGGQVKVNNAVAEVGMTVTDTDKVFIGKKRIINNTAKVYIALNKPSGITCTTDKKDATNVVDFIGYHERIFPIGRLDKDSEGLILLTNDGDIVNRILRAGNAHEKAYLVTVNKPIDPKFAVKMSSGVKIHNTVTLPCKVKVINPTTFTIVLTQGLNRQIRLMCEALGYEVTGLSRTRIMNINLKGLGKGRYRKLTETEVKALLDATQDSVQTEEASRQNGAIPKKQNKKNPSVRYAKKQKVEKSRGKNGGQGKKTKNDTTHKKRKSPIRNKMKKKK